MINRKHDLSLVQQCKALKLHRTTIYREPKPVSQDQLDLMKVIDSIHLDEPAWGVRKVRQYLIESGIPVGRRHCNTIFRKLGLCNIMSVKCPLSFNLLAVCCLLS